MSFKPFPYSSVIFDFDGTLAALTLDFALMQREGIAALGKFVPLPQGLTKLSLEDIESYSSALPEKEATLAREAAHQAFKAVELEAASRSSLFPFVRPMLAALDGLGVRAGIITRNCREAVRTVFPDLDRHNIRLVTREDVARVKPHPEHLLTACKLLSTPAAKALMVGDHTMDILTGKRAGAATAGVASGETPLETLATAQPDFLARDAGELMAQLGLALHPGRRPAESAARPGPSRSGPVRPAPAPRNFQKKTSQ